MKVGLIDVDGHNFPNLALMKLSAWHKAQGDEVEWYNGLEWYDRVYMSKVFTFTADDLRVIQASETIKGGTGYDMHTLLPTNVEHILPDYLLYPKSEKYDGQTAFGFLTRGCPNRCKWCIVPMKEGKVRENADIEEFLDGKKKAILMDNNVLASEFGIRQIEKIVKMKLRVDFNQGLDARLIDNAVANLLAKVKWIDYIRLACDKHSQIQEIKKAYKLLQKHGYSRKIFCYTLIQELKESYDRINHFRNEKWFIPHAQPYRDFTSHLRVPDWQSDMARWANRTELFRSCDFKDYRPRKDFVCGEYF